MRKRQKTFSCCNAASRGGNNHDAIIAKKFKERKREEELREESITFPKYWGGGVSGGRRLLQGEVFVYRTTCSIDQKKARVKGEKKKKVEKKEDGTIEK